MTDRLEVQRVRAVARAGFELLLSLSVATAGVALLEQVAPTAGLGILYLLAVMFMAVRHGQFPALVAAFGSVLAFNFFFIEPRHRLAIAHSENVVALGVFLIAALVVGRLAAAVRRRAAEAEARAREAAAREREAALLARAASSIIARPGIEAQLRSVAESVGAAAGGVARIALGATPQPREGEIAVSLRARAGPAWLYLSSEAGWERADLERIAEPLARLIDVAFERVHADERIAEADSAQRADVAKTAVLHAISHDLRSPLTGIMTAASGLSRDLSAEDRSDLVSVLQTETARLARLVDDLLDLSRIQAGALHPRRDWCDLRDAMITAAAQVREARGDFPLEFGVPEDLPLVQADPAQLERVFFNLLDNARRFSPPGEQVSVSGGVGGGRVTVRVTDRGRGIPPPQRARVFEPFFRGDSSRGSGLGLAICRGFVEANGGRILLQTGAGRGTSFAVSFPLVQQPATARA